MAGTWSQTQRRGTVDVRVEAFGRLDRAVKEGIEAEAEDLARFLETPVHVIYG